LRPVVSWVYALKQKPLRAITLTKELREGRDQ